MNGQESIFILGAGGHGKVVTDSAYSSYPLKKITIYDTCSDLIGTNFLKKWTIQDGSCLEKVFRLHVAIGNNMLRKELSKKHIHDVNDLATIIHHKAIVSDSSTIFSGTFIAAGAIIAPEVTLGYGVIINHMAVIDHNCIVGDWAHIASNATLGGNVKIGNGVLVGAGAVILPGRHIGDYAVIGAGAVVTKDISTQKTVVGVPARSIEP